jgi:dienelactone hydrolase
MTIKRNPSRFRYLSICIISILVYSSNFCAQSGSKTLNLPEPRGPYSVGTMSLYLLDTSRQDTVSNAAAKQRELMVQIWYPARDSARMATSPYSDLSSAAAMATRFKFPKGFETNIQTHSKTRVPFAKSASSCPVVMLEHGMGMLPSVYSSLAEGLASFGFVVVGTNHTYTSMTTTFPDGRSIQYTAPWPTNVERKVQGAAMGKYLDVWVADVRFVLNELERLNQQDAFWRNRLDMKRVGIVGHSYGGTTAAVAAKADERIMAAVNLDGSIYPGMESPVEVGKPYLAITTAESSNIHSEFSGRAGQSYAVIVKGSTHMSFTDVNLLENNFGSTTEASKANFTLEILENTRDLTIEFLSKYLRGELAPQLDTGALITRK